jgi:hypothetical protein
MITFLLSRDGEYLRIDVAYQSHEQIADNFVSRPPFMTRPPFPRRSSSIS